ncbi:uncharacterized protein C2orf92 homolog isoform X7 [Bubalus bubalis]|uniref:uncharacterized protein C2orf92 homolog isoform X7 n=1 Tax=Bubalus bubalis TaxID=89462 RepID=UPI001D12D98D|nr:uncharacterized protein C2orf92 homolog isoform X7 [Bubalus bubalis]
MEPGNFPLRFPSQTPKLLTGPGKRGPEFSPLPSQLWNIRLAQGALKERVKAGSNAESSSNSKILDKGLAKLFENNPADDQNHNPPHVENISQTLRRSSDHIAEEQRDQESSLFNRDVSDTQSTTINKGTLQEAVSPDVLSRGMPCSQLLQFLQKNIIVAAVSVVGIVTATGLLLLALVTYIRKKQSLHSPADITYNIFIMNGKTWWQKSQDKKTKKHAGKQKRLKLNSGI